MNFAIVENVFAAHIERGFANSVSCRFQSIAQGFEFFGPALVIGDLAMNSYFSPPNGF
jgi:hypothetical protein